DISFGGVWMENPYPRGGAKSIWPVHVLGVEKQNHNVEIADLNNDGYQDIIMRGESDSQVVFLVQGRAGGWTTRVIDPGFGRNGLAVADVDGDTFLDVIAPGFWLKNPGGNILVGEWNVYQFGEWEAYAAIDTEDIDGDGRVDIALSASEKSGKVSWFKNPVDPTQRWEEYIIDIDAVDCAHALKIVDVDKDGLMDVVTSEFRGAGRLLVYYQKVKKNTWIRQVLGTPFLHNLVVGDLDNDGDQDFAGAIVFGKGNVEVWENQITTLRSTASSGGKILLFWKTDVAFHGSIPDAIRAIRELAQENKIDADATADAHWLTDQVLAQYKAVVFLSTQGDILNSEQKSAFERYIQAGGGFVGIHSAADTEHSWEWYRELVGTYYGGSHSEIVKSVVHTENSAHPSTKGLPSKWVMMDEWYNFSPNPRTTGINILLSVDETTYEGGNMKGDHPVAWYHEYDGGRSWYTAGGASQESWTDAHFKHHVWGGIKYAAKF
ncbi:MAG: ThuA domain-containing protein, partial [Nitrospira sp.]|nr:ThuA domain-containing protein [Nitrospira sp.]